MPEEGAEKEKVEFFGRHHRKTLLFAKIPADSEQ
jgi:hypothetical protein